LAVGCCVRGFYAAIENGQAKSAPPLAEWFHVAPGKRLFDRSAGTPGVVERQLAGVHRRADQHECGDGASTPFNVDAIPSFHSLLSLAPSRTPNSYNPAGSVVSDSAGNLYGTMASDGL